MFLKVKQVADRLNISPSKVYELVERGQIPHFRFGGAIRFSEEQLGAYLNDNERGRGEKAKAWPKVCRKVTLKHLR